LGAECVDKALISKVEPDEGIAVVGEVISMKKTAEEDGSAETVVGSIIFSEEDEP
jgi:hypothetical protein